MRETTLTYPKQLLELWRQGHVHKVWFWYYRGLFDKFDFQNASSPKQRRAGYHFGEWFTAIHFFTRGYEVLTEKYGMPGRKKGPALLRILGRKGAKFLTGGTVHRPDLLVFDAPHNSFFFVEVKRVKEPLNPAQRKTFRQIEKELGCQVLVVRLKPV
jgi:hypothetical protein